MTSIHGQRDGKELDTFQRGVPGFIAKQGLELFFEDVFETRLAMARRGTA